MGNRAFTAFDPEITSRAERAIAQGALTNSKRPSCFVEGVYPTHSPSGVGCFLGDTIGNRYIDYICGLGSNVLGYADDEVGEVINWAWRTGATLSLSSTLEIETSESLKALFPFVHLAKFYMTGSEACTVAVRIARAATGRKFVYSQGYHGMGDEFIGLTPPHLGVIPSGYMRTLPASFEEMVGDTAAVIVEPVMTDASDARRAWLQSLRDFCTKNGIALIFDEVITGLRFLKGSVSNAWGITPDLICLGKAIGSGVPISAVGGGRMFMNCGEYFASSTYSGNRISLAAAKKTIELMQGKYSFEALWDAGEKFQKKFNQLEPEKVWIEGYPTRGVFKGDELIKALFWQEACKAGILFGPSWFFNFRHIDQTDAVISTCNDIFRRIRMGGVQLEGRLPQSPFAQRMRETHS